MSTSSMTAQTADRALAVLEAIAECGPCRLADIVSGTGLERRIAGRLVGSLVAANLIEETGSGRYELGTRLIELGALAERRNGLRAKARPIAENLMRLTGATTIVHRVQGRELTPVLTMVPTDVLAVSYPKGRRIGLHVGIGRAVLAWLPDHEIRAVLAEVGSSLDQDNWAARLEDIRASHIAVSYGELLQGVTAVGAAIRRADGLPIAALVVAAPEGAHPERYAGQVAESAAAISAILSAAAAA